MKQEVAFATPKIAVIATLCGGCDPPHSRIKPTLPPQPHDRRFQPLARIRWPLDR